MKRSYALILLAALLPLSLFGCTATEPVQTTEAEASAPTEIPVPTVTDPPDPTAGVEPENIYYVGPEREHKSITQLFLDLKDDYSEKIIYIDPGTYDIFKEYKDAEIPSPPDDVRSPDYFDYNAFLPLNTRLIGIGQVVLDFSPEANEITYGESRTWSPLNILGACYIENIEIYCKNGRYCIHDDSHNQYQDTLHYYKNVRCTYERSDFNADGKRLGFNHTIGNGMAQGSTFLFDDCYFEFKGGTANPAFYTHESGSENPWHAPTLTFRSCTFKGGIGNSKTICLQNLATADIYIPTLFENCTIEGGIYLNIYSDSSAQHYDVTLVNSGNPLQMIDQMHLNRYPIRVVQ